METRAHHIFIGLFVLIMIGVLASSVFWLGRFEDRVSYNRYNIDFEEAVSGLSDTANVVISGITVGRVEKIGLHPNDISRVRVVIAVDERIPVRVSTIASLALQGVSGFGIEMTTSDDKAALLEPTEDEDLPTIKVKRSQVSQMLETVPNILQNVNILIARFDDLITQNNETVGKSLEAVEEGLRFLNDRTSDIDAILKDVRKITSNSVKVSQDVAEITSDVTTITSDISQKIEPIIAEMGATITKYKDLATSLEKIIDTEGAGTAAAVRNTLENISKASESFANASVKFETMVTAAEPSINRFTSKGLKDAELLLKEAKDTLSAIKRMVRQMESNPQRFIFGDKTTPKYNSN
ncbi:MAG: MCE family protein [Rhizobiales bacterium]|nr:MlaD family protein [Hyphomicrobiales bacterium]NRB13852.1 MCE family protein [Hyphomicrobiales bacterium]